MSTKVLSLRVSRRAIGAAVLDSRGLAHSDGRHLPSAPTRAILAATRYVERLLSQSITAAVVDAPPRGVSATTDAVLDAIAQVLTAMSLTPILIGKWDVLVAYGATPLRTRGDVRELVRGYWPELDGVRANVKPHAIDAAAAALYAECQVSFSRSPS